MPQHALNAPKRLPCYSSPQILTRGLLKQFSGSPFDKKKGLELPGLPGQ